MVVTIADLRRQGEAHRPTQRGDQQADETTPMTEKTRPEVFDDNLPPFTEAEVQKALETNRMALSFDTLPVPMDSGEIVILAVKFAIGDGTTTTVLLDRFAAILLAGAVSHLQANGWKVTETTPSGTKPN